MIPRLLQDRQVAPDSFAEATVLVTLQVGENNDRKLWSGLNDFDEKLGIPLRNEHPFRDDKVDGLSAELVERLSGGRCRQNRQVGVIPEDGL